jgi:Na+/H+ antiporter NhaD/arsenite permease-like protein
MHGSGGAFEPHVIFGWSPLWVSTVILVITYGIIMSERLNRSVIALLGSAALIITGVLDQPEAFKGIDWNTIALLTGMMIMVAVSRKSGLFQYVAILSAKWVKANPTGLIAALGVVTAVFSAFLDNVTTVLLVAPVTLAICKELKVPPYPFLFAEIFASNIGGTATLIGDPPNILIGSLVGLSFNDFVINLTPVVIVTLIVQTIMIHLVWGRSMRAALEDRARVMAMNQNDAIADRKLMLQSVVVLAAVVVVFVLARTLELEPGTIAMTGAAVLLAFDIYGHHPEKQSERVTQSYVEIEWVTIFFFMGLFIVVHGVEVGGLLKILADWLLGVTGGDLHWTTIAILWSSAVLSAIIDNIPFVATMIPLIKNMAPAFGGPEGLMPLWWALSLGACLGGNGTLIGASANLTVAGIAERNGVSFRFMTYIKHAFWMMLVSIVISHVYIVWRYL